jgi:hypothetical protein
VWQEQGRTGPHRRRLRDSREHPQSREAQDYKYKLALAKAGKDGSILAFKKTTIKADGAQFYACRDIRKIYELPDATLLDGFFIIESEEPLDVIAVYTTVQRVFERKFE